MTHYCFVHLEFGSDHRDRSLKVIDKFRAAAAKSGDRSTLVVVDNARTAQDEPLQRSGFEPGLLMAGDNTTREFTGWDKAIGRILDSGLDPDVWIFTNDTLALRHGWGDRKAAAFGEEIHRLSGHEAPWLLGEIKDFPHSIKTPLGPLLENVATYCFAMNRELRDGLSTLNPGEEFLDAHVYDRYEDARALYRDNVDPAYVDWTCRWLLKNGSEGPSNQTKYKWAYEWHNAAPLNAKTFGSMRMKARCCLAESVLTARARTLGADIRSPYHGQNARDRIRTTMHFLQDKMWEKYLMRKVQREMDAAAESRRTATSIHYTPNVRRESR
ncbi:MAG: hypothetical protein KKC85_15315 [Gammaproteobacteria bacterium]|nr:hypothetical protein [Gammaproteobacteria bacterium]